MVLVIKRVIRSTTKVPVKVIKLKWLDAVAEKLQRLPCSACGQEIGKYKWASAWVLVGGEKHERGLRLCMDCARIAENPDSLE